ncbi:hypothetical protein J6590_033516 [Homalodisca vitripennis]|nr:hypothetical protein J6590_033516 [Homalodisca vitripennis]
METGTPRREYGQWLRNEKSTVLQHARWNVVRSKAFVRIQATEEDLLDFFVCDLTRRYTMNIRFLQQG